MLSQEFFNNKNSSIRSYILLLSLLSLLIVLGWFISIESVQPIRAWIVTVIAGLFLIGTILVLKMGLNTINLFFAGSLGLYCVITLLLLLTYYNRFYESLWPNLIFFLIIAPLGMYYSGTVLLYGLEEIVSGTSIFVTLVTLFIAISISYHIYNPDGLINVIVTDAYNAVILGLVVYQYFQVRSLYNQSTRTFNLLILGFIIAIAGLLFNILLAIFFSVNNPFRLMVPTIGLLVVISSFLKLSNQQLLTRTDDIHHSMGHFVERLEVVIPKLQLLVKTETEIISKEPISLEQHQLPTKPDISLNLQNAQQRRFNHHLKEKMNGLTISILIEVANTFPSAVTGTWLGKKLRKSKTTINDQIRNLITLGYLTKSISLSDIRQRPLMLTKDGSTFLKYLHYKFQKYLSKLGDSSSNTSNHYNFNETLEEEV